MFCWVFFGGGVTNLTITKEWIRSGVGEGGGLAPGRITWHDDKCDGINDPYTTSTSP